MFRNNFSRPAPRPVAGQGRKIDRCLQLSMGALRSMA